MLYICGIYKDKIKRSYLVRYVLCGTNSSLLASIGGNVTVFLIELFPLPRVGDEGLRRGDVITRLGGSFR